MPEKNGLSLYFEGERSKREEKRKKKKRAKYIRDRERGLRFEERKERGDERRVECSSRPNSSITRRVEGGGRERGWIK